MEPFTLLKYTGTGLDGSAERMVHQSQYTHDSVIWGGRTLRRKEKIVEDDLPVIAGRSRSFRREHPEPGI